MPKKPTSKRLDDLFEGMQDESAKPSTPALPKKHPARDSGQRRDDVVRLKPHGAREKSARKTPSRPVEKKPAVSSAHPAATRPVSRAPALTQTGTLPPLESVSIARRGGADTPSSMSLAFQMDSLNWATLQVVDETAGRSWDQNEQLLVRQVTDQLSQALENARLFQETRSRAEELAALNEMGRELTGLLSIEAIAGAVYKYASRLMDTTNLFVSLYDEAKQEITPIFVINDRERVQVPPRKLGNGLTDTVLRTCEPLFIPDDMSGHMKNLGIEVITLGDTRMAQCWLGAPLLVGESVLGVIGLQSIETPNLFTEHHRDLLTAISSQAAIAIQNARLFEETQTRTRELDALNELNQKLSALLDVDQVLPEIYRGVERLISAKNFYIGLYSPERNEVTFPFNVSESVVDLNIATIPADKGLTGYVLRTRKPILIPENVTEAMQKMGIEVVGEPASCWLGVPLLLGEQVIGVMAAQSYTEPNVYDEHDRDLLMAVAGQAAISIQNSRLYGQEQYRRQIADTLAEMARIASSSLDLNEVVRQLLEQLPRLIPFRTASVQLLEPNGRRLQIGGISRDQERTVALESPPDRFLRPLEEDKLMLEIVKSREVVILNDTQDDPRWEVLPETAAIRSWLGAPLIVGPDVIGILILDENNPNAFSQESAALARAFAPQAAIAIQNARLFDSTQRSEAELRSLFAAMTDVIIVYDRDGRYIRIAPTNPSRLFQPPQDMLGKLIKEVLPAEISQIIMSAITKALETGETLYVEYPLTINQTEYWFDGSVSKLTENQVFLVARDVTARKQAEETLRLQGAALETAANTVVLAQLDGRITWVNPAFTAQTGYTFEEAVGQTPRLFKSGLHDQPFYKGLWDTILGGNAWTGEVTNRRKNGELFIVQQSITPVRDAAGQITHFVSIWQDITERKRVEEVLRASEDRFRSILDNIEDGYYEVDTAGNLTFLNPALTRLFGRSANEMIGMNNRQFMPPEQAKTVFQTYNRVFRTGIPEQAFNWDVARQDGTLRSVESSVSLIKTADGSVTGFRGTVRDITDRKKAEETLQRRNEYLFATAEIGRLVTSTLDMPTLFSRTVNLVRDRFGFYHAGIFVTEETGFQAILQAATGEAGAEMLRQKHSLQVGSKSVVGGVTESGRAVVVNDTAASESHKFNPLLPETRAEAALPLRVGSRTIGALDIQSTQVNAFSEDDIAVLQSLADQIAIAIDNARSYELSMQAVKEMREADRLKSQFLANMSHELRTPLNSIIGFSRVILKGIDGATTDLQQQDLLAIHNSGQHLLGLINDILDLSRIEAGKMELTFDEVNLAELTSSVMSTITGLFKDKPITLHRDLPADLPTVRADAMRIRQVLLNLLSNAAKFTDEGSITVQASVKDSPTGHPEVTVSVTDTGPGIASEDQKKLFQPFSQVDASPTRKSGGSGLGLSISNHLIQMHGGRIGVESAPGRGSTFFFTLPAFRGKTELGTPPGNRIILAIDDDPQVVSLYERYLQPQGYQVVPLGDPSRAVERVRQLKPFAITLDIMMPGYDGWRVLNDLKSNAETRDIPVIVCSIVEEREKGFSLGAADYLVKPILEDDILNVLDRLNVDGSIRDVLIVDDDPNDLRLIGRMLSENGRYRPILAEGGRNGWEAVQARTPHALILDLFMPEMDGFTLLEKMRSSEKLREVPVIVVSGGDLTLEQQKMLQDFGQRMIQKSALNEQQLLSTLERALKHVKP